jgi:hypothetical protein
VEPARAEKSYAEPPGDKESNVQLAKHTEEEEEDRPSIIGISALAARAEEAKGQISTD